MMKKAILFFSFFVILMSCVTKRVQDIEQKNSGMVVEHKENRLFQEKESSSSPLVSSPLKAYSVIPQTSIPNDFIYPQDSNGEYQVAFPIVATIAFYKNNNKIDLVDYENTLIKLSDDQRTISFLPSSNVILLPYKTIKALIKKQENEKIRLEQIPSYQWASGLCGGDYFYLFSVNEKATNSEYQIQFLVNVITTLSAQSIFTQSQTINIAKNSADVKREVESFFSSFYKDVILKGMTEAKKFFSFGKYVKLHIKDVTGALSPTALIDLLLDFNISAKFIEKKSDVLAFDLWYNQTEKEFERHLYSAIEKNLSNEKKFDFIMQDQMVYYYQVVDTNEGILD